MIAVGALMFLAIVEAALLVVLYQANVRLTAALLVQSGDRAAAKVLVEQPKQEPRERNPIVAPRQIGLGVRTARTSDEEQAAS